MEGNSFVRKEKNMGIELLRIISMFMVIFLHILNFGINYQGLESFSANWYISWFLEGFCYCAVNIYAMISGYVMLNSRCRASRIIELWLQVFCYSVISILVLNKLQPELVSRMDIWKSCFPVLSQRFWYFTAYFAIFWFIPFFNWIVDKLSYIQMRKLIYRLILIFGIMPWIAELWGTWAFGLTGGYTALWLSIMYLVGAGIRKYGYSVISFKRKEHSKQYFLRMAVCCGILIYLTKLVLTILNRTVFEYEVRTDIFYSYLSPLVIMEAVFLLCFFCKIKIKQGSFWLKSSGLTFGIYLIHLSPLFGEYVWKRFSSVGNKTPLIFTGVVILGTLLIYEGCAGIEYCRVKIFSICKISPIIESILKNMKKRG